MARGQRSKIRQRRRAPLRLKYEERQKQALIIKHQLLAIKKARESKVMEVTTPQQTDEVTPENSTEKSASVQTLENNKPSKSKLKKMKEARKRKKLGIKKGRWKWT